MRLTGRRTLDLRHALRVGCKSLLWAAKAQRGAIPGPAQDSRVRPPAVHWEILTVRMPVTPGFTASAAVSYLAPGRVSLRPSWPCAASLPQGSQGIHPGPKKVRRETTCRETRDRRLAQDECETGIGIGSNEAFPTRDSQVPRFRKLVSPTAAGRDAERSAGQGFTAHGPVNPVPDRA